MSKKRITLTLQTDKPRHMRALYAIQCMPPGSRTDFAVEMICAGLDREQLYATVMRALKDYQPQFNKEDEAGQIPQDMLDFVFSL